MLSCKNEPNQYFWPSRCNQPDWIDCPKTQKSENCIPENVAEKKSCPDLNNFGNFKVLPQSYSMDDRSETSEASVRCQKGYKLNIPNKIKTKAVCHCNSDECLWKFSRGKKRLLSNDISG